MEVALGLRNPNSEFEHDVLKAVLAQEAGYRVRKLILLAKPGAMKRHGQPGSSAIVGWVKRNHGINVEFRELTNSNKP